MKKSKYNFIQVYNVWVNGRSTGDVDQQYPIDTNINREWHTDLKQATKDFYNAKSEEKDIKTDFGDLIYQDYQVNLYSIDIDVAKFEDKFDLDFDIEDENTQEMIPYYVDYDFSNVAERVALFHEEGENKELPKCCNSDCIDDVHQEGSVYCEFHKSM